MLKTTVSALAAGAVLLASTSAFAGSLAPAVVEPVPTAPIVAPVGSLGGWAPLAGVAAAVAVVAIVASSDDDDDDSTTTTPAE